MYLRFYRGEHKISRVILSDCLSSSHWSSRSFSEMKSTVRGNSWFLFALNCVIRYRMNWGDCYERWTSMDLEWVDFYLFELNTVPAFTCWRRNKKITQSFYYVHFNRPSTLLTFMYNATRAFRVTCAIINIFSFQLTSNPSDTLCSHSLIMPYTDLTAQTFIDGMSVVRRTYENVQSPTYMAKYENEIVSSCVASASSYVIMQYSRRLCVFSKLASSQMSKHATQSFVSRKQHVA